MANIDFSIIENWLKKHGGKTFKSGELDGAPARDAYKSFVDAVIANSGFFAEYSAWQNSGHTLPYFWAKIRSTVSEKKSSMNHCFFFFFLLFLGSASKLVGF